MCQNATKHINGLSKNFFLQIHLICPSKLLIELPKRKHMENKSYFYNTLTRNLIPITQTSNLFIFVCVELNLSFLTFFSSSFELRYETKWLQIGIFIRFIGCRRLDTAIQGQILVKRASNFFVILKWIISLFPFAVDITWHQRINVLYQYR